MLMHWSFMMEAPVNHQLLESIVGIHFLPAKYPQAISSLSTSWQSILVTTMQTNGDSNLYTGLAVSILTLNLAQEGGWISLIFFEVEGSICFVFPVSTFIEKFESMRNFFPCYQDHKKWTKGKQLNCFLPSLTDVMYTLKFPFCEDL